MADKNSQGEPKPEVQFAKRIDISKEGLSQDQQKIIRQVELEQLKKKVTKLRGRNVATALTIGALVLGIYGYTFHSVSQERVMDEIDAEAKAARLQASNTDAS